MDKTDGGSAVFECDFEDYFHVDRCFGPTAGTDLFFEDYATFDVEKNSPAFFVVEVEEMRTDVVEKVFAVADVFLFQADVFAEQSIAQFESGYDGDRLGGADATEILG